MANEHRRRHTHTHALEHLHNFKTQIQDLVNYLSVVVAAIVVDV